MYYIVNHTEHIIAADSSLLELLSVENIDALYTKIALGDITFSPSDDKVTITTENNTSSYQIKNHTLSGMLGDITLVEISQEEEKVKEETLSILDDEPITFSDEPITFSDEPITLADEPITFSDDAKIEILEETENKITFDDEPFDLMSDIDETDVENNTSEETKSEEVFIKTPEAIEVDRTEDAVVTEPEVDTTPILIDVHNISQDIGISTDDYNNFLNEYIDTALTLEKDLKSTDTKKRAHAIGTLSHLSNVLHLPVVTKIVKQLDESSPDEQNTLIRSLYATLARLTTTADADIKETAFLQEDSTPEAEVEAEAEAEDITTESFGTIDLSDVQPIHFDFQMEAAANDLSLPVELIEEFVHDFIEQAHVETEKMLALYKEGDLDAIQKIGHLLKGTASNLRINPLADTLYEIQFCEDSSNLEHLIKEYWGHFLSFETQINLTSK